jgi:hypothetical protein
MQEGSRKAQPHGREWLKKVTGLGEAQAVKVVGNGGGGPKRVWNPATRRLLERATELFGAWRGGRREVDSPSWERRRGGKPQGSRDVDAVGQS